MFDLIVMLIFISFLWVNYSKTKNMSGFWFLIPLAMSTLLNTTLPSTWSQQFFVIYRIGVLIACFGAGVLYYVGTKKHRQKILAQEAERWKANKTQKRKKKK